MGTEVQPQRGERNGELSVDGSATLLELIALIQSSIADVIDEHAIMGVSVPPLDSCNTIPGPFDAPDVSTPRLLKAIRTVEAACAQLCASIASPALSLVNKSLAFEECAALQVALGAGVADHLQLYPDGLHVTDLGERTGLESDKLARVLRLLATKHVFREVKPNVFANNRLSVKLLSSDSCSDFVSHKVHECFEVAVHSYATLADKSQNAPKNCWERVHGVQMFDYLRSEKNKDKATRFAKSMTGWADITGRDTLTKVYPWHTLPTSKPIKICDVGGGNGHVVLALLKSLPSHRLEAVVQDMPSMLEEGRVLWSEQFPEAVNEGKVEFVPIDFFKQAPVEGCDFYYLRHCLHNWSDEKCILLLSNIAAAMRASTNKSSRLLIHDLVIQYATSSSPMAPPGLEYAPPPLLANYGAGRVRAYDLDINMLHLLGDAKERTVEEFVELGSKAGLDLLRVWDAGSTFDSIVEFKIQEIKIVS